MSLLRTPALAVLICGLVVGLPAPAQAALVAAYNFSEGSGSTAHATVGSVNGTLLGGASFVAAGIEGGAVSLSRGSPGGLVDFGANLFPGGPFSVQVWVKTTDTQAALPLAYQTAGFANGFLFGINDISDGCGAPAGKASFYVAYPCGGASAITVNDGAWHQLVGVYNGSQTSIYVDGQFQSSSSGGNPLIVPPSGTHFLLGGVMVGSTPTNVYSGLLSDLLLYDEALSAADVNGLYVRAVPEPASAWLLGLGLAAVGIGAVRRLRRQRGS
jgi:hypothetical protein